MRITIALILSVFALAGCSTSNQTTVSTATTTGAATPAMAATPASSAAVASSVAATATAQEDYRLGVRDVVEISVFQVPDFDRTVEVSTVGTIALPLIGDVRAVGRTTNELKDAIAAKLKEQYLQNPQVMVSLKDAKSQQYTIGGAVRKTGVFPLPPGLTLAQAIASAGGLNEIADERGIVIIRNQGGKRTAAVFDYKAITSGKAPDPVLKPGDLIEVDQSGVRTALKRIRETMPVMGLFAPLL